MGVDRGARCAWAGAFAAVLILTLITGGAAWAQADLIYLIEPKLTTPDWSGDVSTRHYGRTDIDNRRRDFGRTDLSLTLRREFELPGGRDSDQFASVHFKQIDVHGRPRLRRQHLPIPPAFYDLRLGLGYKTKIDRDWEIGGTFGLGSASDELFNSFREMYVDSTVYLRVPHGERNRWFVLLNLDTRRPRFPIAPGGGYQFFYSPKFNGIVGLPFSVFYGSLTKELSYRIGYVIPETIHASMVYRFDRKFRGTAAFDWVHEYFMETNRRDTDERFDFEEKRFTVTGEYFLTRNWALEGTVGWAFDRRIAEGEDNNERSDSELQPDDTWFVGLSVKFRF